MRLKKLIRPLVTLFALLICGGCVRSLHPIYTSSDLVFHEKLIGTWKQSDGRNTWQFTEAKDDDRHRAYRVVLTDGDGRTGTFLAHLVKINEELFLDLYPVAPNVANNNFYKWHFQRVHSFLHVERDQANFHLTPMNPKWLNEHLKDHPDAIAHCTLNPSGHPDREENGNPAERLLLTASTEKLQKFLTKHLDTEAFGDPIELTPMK